MKTNSSTIALQIEQPPTKVTMDSSFRYFVTHREMNAFQFSNV
jgi:hypothetical protein